MEKLMSKKFKLIWILIVAVFYILNGMISTQPSMGSIILIIANILTIVAILLYAEKVVLSIILFTLAELCNWATWVVSLKSVNALQIANPELYILIIGSVIALIFMILNIKKNKLNLGKTFKEKAVSILTFKQRPRKLKPIFRVIIYCLFITACTSVAKSMTILGRGDITLLTAMLAIIPTFTVIATVGMISDMYIMHFIASGGMLIITYMQIVIGKVSVLSAISTLIITITLILGYIDYRREEKKISQQNKQPQIQFEKLWEMENALAEDDKGIDNTVEIEKTSSGQNNHTD